MRTAARLASRARYLPCETLRDRQTRRVEEQGGNASFPDQHPQTERWCLFASQWVVFDAFHPEPARVCPCWNGKWHVSASQCQMQKDIIHSINGAFVFKSQLKTFTLTSIALRWVCLCRPVLQWRAHKGLDHNFLLIKRKKTRQSPVVKTNKHTNCFTCQAQVWIKNRIHFFLNLEFENISFKESLIASWLNLTAEEVLNTWVHTLLDLLPSNFVSTKSKSHPSITPVCCAGLQRTGVYPSTGCQSGQNTPSLNLVVSVHFTHTECTI